MLEITICIGSSCHLKGSYNVIQEMQQIIEDSRLHEQVAVKGTFCMKQCQAGVSVGLNGTHYSLRPGKCTAFFDEHITPLLQQKPPRKTRKKKDTSA